MQQVYSGKWSFLPSQYVGAGKKTASNKAVEVKNNPAALMPTRGIITNHITNNKEEHQLTQFLEFKTICSSYMKVPYNPPIGTGNN